jgi:hypothetical protein
MRGCACVSHLVWVHVVAMAVYWGLYSNFFDAWDSLYASSNILTGAGIAAFLALLAINGLRSAFILAPV